MSRQGYGELLSGEEAVSGECLSCGAQSGLSAGCVDVLGSVNSLLVAMGEPEITEREANLCRGCYDRHHRRMWEEDRRISDKIAETWRNFQRSYRAASSDGQRREMWAKWRTFLIRNRWWDAYEGLSTAWKAEEDARRSRGAS